MDVTRPHSSLFLTPELEIARYRYDRVKPLNKFGYNAAIGTSYETVWSHGGLYPWDLTPGIATIVSDYAADVSQVVVTGVDSNFEEFEVTVTLQGTTPVQVGADVKHICRAYAEDIDLVGVVLISLDSTVIARIDPEHNQTLTSTCVVPAGYTGYVISGIASTGKGKDATVEFKGRTNDKSFRTLHIAQIYQSSYRFNFDLPLRVEEKTIMEVRGVSSASGTLVSAAYNMVLIKEK